MGQLDQLKPDDLEAILYAPFFVYSTIASADGEAMEAHFRRLRAEIDAGRSVFGEATVGAEVIKTLAVNQDVLWEGYVVAGRSPRDGLKRTVKALRRVPPEESRVYRDWLVVLGTRIATVRHVIGDDLVSSSEATAVRDVAKWLDRPVPR